MAKDKKAVLGEALDLLDGICAKVALNRETHVQVQMASQMIRAEINKDDVVPEEDKKKGAEDGEGEK